MVRTAQHTHGAHAVRVLALLAVLVGLLAMHGLASSHHAPAAATDHSSSAQTHAPAAVHGHATDVRGAASQPAEPLAPPAGPVCDDDDCPSVLLTLCVAVLATTAAVAVGVVLLRLRRRALATARAPALSVPTDARAGVPPPDPVRELCVSRT